MEPSAFGWSKRLVAFLSQRTPPSVRAPAKAAYARRWGSVFLVAVKPLGTQFWGASGPSRARHMLMRRPFVNLAALTWDRAFPRAGLRCR